MGALPSSITDVRELPGDLSIARLRSGSECRLAEFLNHGGYGFYNPRETVIKEYPSGKGTYVRRSWDRGVMPGLLVVSNGYEGRQACAQFGRMWSNTLYGFIGFQYSGALARQLRDELFRIQQHLREDPTLKHLSGLAPGVRCRVTSGAFKGLEGKVSADGPGETFVVELRCLGVVEVQIDGRLLEPI